MIFSYGALKVSKVVSFRFKNSTFISTNYTQVDVKFLKLKCLLFQLPVVRFDFCTQTLS